MKSLLLLRHGKAEQFSDTGGDYNRTLTGRGRKDVKSVIELAESEMPKPDAIVSSGAARAKETAEIAAEALHFEAEIGLTDVIYDADTDDLLAVVRGLDDSAATIMLVGHNPGFEELAAMLVTDDQFIGHMPTSGLVWIELPSMTWSEVEPGTGALRGSYAPPSSH